MTNKEYLEQVYRIDQRINSKIEQVASLESMIKKATATLSDSPRSASPDLKQMENTILKIVELKAEINNDIDALVDLKRDITTSIKSIKNPEHQTLLEKRYLCFKTWEQIAEDMGYSLQHTFRLCDKALIEISPPER